MFIKNGVLDNLEGSIRKNELIKGEFTIGGVKEITFGQKYLKSTPSREEKLNYPEYQDEIVLWVQNLLSQFHYLVTGDPDINAFYDVLGAFGLDQTIEFIGMNGMAKIYEVR